MYHEKTKDHMGRLKEHLGTDLGPMSKYTDPVLDHLKTTVDLSPYTDSITAHLSQPAPFSVSGSQELNDPDSMRAIGGYFRYGD
jgi:hypothetical protein